MTRSVTVITGLTATGKTSYALNLAKKNGGVLLSTDSRQIYKELTIISGKDIGRSKFTLVSSKNGFDIGYYIIDGIQLWLYDVVSVTNAFSSFDFVRLAQEVIKNHISKNTVVIFVGGTYLYLKHFFFGFETEDIKPDLELRDKLNKYSVYDLQKELKRINSDVFSSLNNSDKNNPHRLIRKIEIAQAQPKTITPGVIQVHTPGCRYTFTPGVIKAKWVGLKHKNNALLEERIRNRVVKRVKNGAINELSNIFEQYKTYELTGLSALGCSFIKSFLNSEISKQELIEKWTRQEIQYAKRQFVFMKQNKDIKWEEI